MRKKLSVMHNISIIVLVFGLFVTSCRDKKYSSSIVSIKGDTIQYNIGDTVFPYRNYDFSVGSWRAELNIHKDDRNSLPGDFVNKRKSSTKDFSVLNKLMDCGFIYMGSDVATIQSGLTLYRDEQIVTAFEIVLEKSTVGLQSSNFGWLKSTDRVNIIQILNEFR